MNQKQLIVIVLMLGIAGAGGYVLKSGVSRSQAAYQAERRDGLTSPNSPTDTQAPQTVALDITPEVLTGAKQAVIGQLIAFKKDDYREAIRYQAAALRTHFPSVTGFRAMIRNAYPQFANYKSVTFGIGKMSEGGSEVSLPVQLTGEDGITVSAVYFLHRENSGYRVSGVTGGFPPQPKPQVRPHFGGRTPNGRV